jgi:hypothetical protein
VRIRKTIIGLTAVAVLAVPAAASANVNYDDYSVGFVGKGDVQTALGGINDAAMQQLWGQGKVKFTSKVVNGNETRWKCGSGVNGQTSLVTQAQALDVKANTNKAGKLTNGWDLNGRSGVGGTYISGKRVGAPYVGYCPAGQAFGGFLDNVFTTDYLPGVQVNGIDLPNAPVEVAPAA